MKHKKLSEAPEPVQVFARNLKQMLDEVEIKQGPQGTSFAEGADVRAAFGWGLWPSDADQGLRYAIKLESAGSIKTDKNMELICNSGIEPASATEWIANMNVIPPQPFLSRGENVTIPGEVSYVRDSKPWADYRELHAYLTSDTGPGITALVDKLIPDIDIGEFPADALKEIRDRVKNAEESYKKDGKYQDELTEHVWSRDDARRTYCENLYLAIDFEFQKYNCQELDEPLILALAYEIECSLTLSEFKDEHKKVLVGVYGSEAFRAKCSDFNAEVEEMAEIEWWNDKAKLYVPDNPDEAATVVLFQS